MQEPSKSDVGRAFGEMGEILYRAKKVVEIAVFGGAAILQFEAVFRTGDVGARVEPGDHGAVLEAARTVADCHGHGAWFVGVASGGEPARLPPARHFHRGRTAPPGQDADRLGEPIVCDGWVCDCRVRRAARRKRTYAVAELKPIAA